MWYADENGENGHETMGRRKKIKGKSRISLVIYSLTKFGQGVRSVREEEKKMRRLLLQLSFDHHSSNT